MIRRVLCVALVAGCVEQPLPWSEPDQVGPYAVGATTRTFVDDRGVELTMELWYPAVPAEGAEPSDYGNLSVVRAAFRDADVDVRGAPYPLVAFSHGFGGIRYQSTFLTEHLASHGFVVVAPDHPNNTTFDLDEDLTDAVALARPGDVSSAVDRVVALSEGTGRLEGIVGDGTFAMVGHSFGAWTSLAVGGGTVDLDATLAHCAEHDDPSCRFLSLTDVPDASDTVPDPRAATVVTLAPGGAYTFGDGGLLSVPTPMVIGGRLDGDLPYDEEIRPAYDALGEPKTLVTLARTGHWAFTDLCELVDFFDDCGGEDDGFMDPDVVQARTNTLTTAHLRWTMLGSEADAAWLDADAWESDPDVVIEHARQPSR